MIEHKGQLLTYSVLLDSLWEEGVQLLDKHALAVNINRLRKKIETKEHTYISNVYGMGYEKLYRVSDLYTDKNQEVSEEKESLKELVSDISHQTKTPIANIN